MLSIVRSLGLSGIDPFGVLVEVNLSRSIPCFEIVGLPDAAVRESRERVRSALSNGQYPYPQGRITVNLAPADVRKNGTLYDLPIFVGLMAGQEHLSIEWDTTAFLGELSLSGEVRGAEGVLPMVLGARELGITRVFIPYANAAEASVARDVDVRVVRHASQVVEFLRGGALPPPASSVPPLELSEQPQPDFSEVRGQVFAKRALEIAAAGNHNALLLGTPGSGKSMLAKRLPSILPNLTEAEAIETTKLYSACGRLPAGTSLLQTRPFRAPHHSISMAGLCGGGANPRPGEISLAHNGILFLDELPEFQRQALEALRQPLEDGVLTIARAAAILTYPSRFMLVAAMNPCPCGFFGTPDGRCTCGENKVNQYLSKISGPLLDRLDLHVEVLPVDYESLSDPKPEESSAQVRTRVNAARSIQSKRFAGTAVTSNAQIPPASLREICVMNSEADRLLQNVFEKLHLSGRAYERILKVSRTIADLDASDTIQSQHLMEAVQYRSLDRKYWKV